jgi:hypothetical protein
MGRPAGDTLRQLVTIDAVGLGIVGSAGVDLAPPYPPPLDPVGIILYR